MHYPGHLRDAFYEWLEEGCPPLASVEVNYEPQTWEAERLLRKMLACSDILPRDVYELAVGQLDDDRVPSQTCGSVARALLDQFLARTTA